MLGNKWKIGDLVKFKSPKISIEQHDIYKVIGICSTNYIIVANTDTPEKQLIALLKDIEKVDDFIAEVYNSTK